MSEPLSMEPVNRRDRGIAEGATARTLELVAEWLRERSTVCQKAGNHYRANALSGHADLIERGAFSDWLKEREASGG